MCWDKGGNRFLCKMTEEEARKKVEEIIERHKGKTLLKFMKIYAPPNENEHTYYECVSQNSDIALNTVI